MSKTQSKLGITVLNNCNCNCWAQINFELFGSGDTELYLEGCVDGVINWQTFNTTTRVWTTIQVGGTFLGVPIYDTYTRVKITKPGCCDTYSNVSYAYLL